MAQLQKIAADGMRCKIVVYNNTYLYYHIIRTHLYAAFSVGLQKKVVNYVVF